MRAETSEEVRGEAAPGMREKVRGGTAHWTNRERRGGGVHGTRGEVRGAAEPGGAMRGGAVYGTNGRVPGGIAHRSILYEYSLSRRISTMFPTGAVQNNTNHTSRVGCR